MTTKCLIDVVVLDTDDWLTDAADAFPTSRLPKASTATNALKHFITTKSFTSALQELITRSSLFKQNILFTRDVLVDSSLALIC
jgi:hypothetical protein